MEQKDKHSMADAAVITPQTQDYGIPPMGELIDSLFAGFAPVARGAGSDMKERGDWR